MNNVLNGEAKTPVTDGPELMNPEKIEMRWQSKKLQMQGAQILRNEAYLWGTPQ